MNNKGVIKNLLTFPQNTNAFDIYKGFPLLDLNFEVTETGATLKIQDEFLNLSSDEFNMCREGDVPKSIQKIAESLNVDTSTIVRAARLAILPEVTVDISKKDRISGYIRNGPEGLIRWIREVETKKDDQVVYATDVARFVGHIGPVCVIDSEIRGLGLGLNGKIFEPMPIGDFYALIRDELAIPVSLLQKLKEVINSWVNQVIANGEALDIRTSPIYVDNNIIHADFPHTGDIADILKKLRNFLPDASHPLAYLTTLAWTIFAPLHDELKRHAQASKRIQAPEILMAGKTQAGKTPLGDFFVGKGLAMTKDAYFYPYQTVRTTFTLMRHLGETNLPAVFDDLPADWLPMHAEDLKAYVQSGHFGDRGRSNQTIQEYRGKRSFVGTVNQSIRIDDDLATSMRLIILRFTEKNRKRKNLPAWNALVDGLPDGFLYAIFRELFEGKNIEEITRDVEKFQKPADWINYIIQNLNILGQKYAIPEWPLYSEESSSDDDNNAIEVAEAFIAEWERIKRNEDEYEDSQLGKEVRSIKYRSPIEGEFFIDWNEENKKSRYFIYFTGPAFKTLVARQQLKLPYRNATDFLNNIASADDSVRVENEGKSRPKRIGNIVMKMYCVSVPEEVDPDE